MAFSTSRPWRAAVAACAWLVCSAASAAVTVSTVYSFTGGADGATPAGSAVLGIDGKLHGISTAGTWSLSTAGAGMSVMALPGTLSSTYVRSPLVATTSGRIVGTLYTGGGDNGSVFSFTPTTPLTVNSAAAATVPRYPNGNIAGDAAGNVFVLDRGATSGGAGAIKKLSADGTAFKTVMQFDPETEFSRVNAAAVIVGSDGVLYGVNSSKGAKGGGYVYSLQPDGSGLKVLHNFDAATEGQPGTYLSTFDGANNSSGLVEVGVWLYGSTYDGGASANGSVYRIRKDGTAFQVLHLFNDAVNRDGKNAAGLMVLAADGNVYGSSNTGGANGDGTLWRIATANASNTGGGFEVLQSFQAATTGKVPVNLSLGSDGFIYGITQSGGARDLGTVFKIDTGYVPPLPLPQITLFQAAPDALNLGASTTLTWTTASATACTASGVWSGAKPTSGSEVRTPSTVGSNIFTLRCTGPGGDVTQSASVLVAPPPAAVITSFTATPTTLPLGGTVTLAWTSKDATACTAASTGAGSDATLWTGSQPGNGTATLTPTAGGEHVFTLNCQGAGGNDSASLSVDVTLAARITTFSAAAASVLPGASATVSWVAADATSCIASGAWTGAKATSGTESITPVAGDNFYTLRCYGVGGDEVKSVKVTAAAPVAPTNPNANPDAGSGGGPLGGLLLAPLAGLWLLRRRARA